MPNDNMEIEDQEIKLKGEKSDEQNESMQNQTYTLKRLVRLLHINKPVYHVMALLGKR